MKRTLTTTLMALLLCVCIVFGLTACGTSQEEVDTTISTAIAPISEQITAINSSIDDLKAVDTALDGYIDALETKVTELESTATAEEITAVKSAIETLKAKDTELEGKITTLEIYVNTELSATEDWAEATFATLAQYAEIQSEISNIKTTLTTLVDTTELSTAISTSESGMKAWVNETLADGYYTIAEIDTKLTDLETKLAGADDTLEATIEEQKTALATAKTELTTAYTTAINEAITENNGVINTKIATDIATAKADLQTQINSIITELATIKADIQANKTDIDKNAADIADLLERLEALESENAELEIRINCLEGKHVINETETISYVYTWSETAPTSTKNYTCLHCEKAIEETVSASVWQVGDKVTYIAKDGNSYISTVGEITDSKAVLVSDEMWSTGKTTTSQEKLLAIVEDKGARVPSSTEAVWSNIIKPWLSSTLPVSSGGNSDKTESIVYNSSGVFSRVVNYQGISIYTTSMSQHYDNNNTWVGRYIWDVEFSTAE